MFVGTGDVGLDVDVVHCGLDALQREAETAGEHPRDVGGVESRVYLVENFEVGG